MRNQTIAGFVFVMLVAIIGLQANGVTSIPSERFVKNQKIDIAEQRAMSYIKQIKDNLIVQERAAQALEHTKQLDCLAKTVFGEARSESILGQQAVAKVISNRVKSPKHPNTYCKVVKYKRKGVYHFSMWNPKDVNYEKTHNAFKSEQYSTAVIRSIKIASEAIKGNNAILPDTALNYHSKAVKPVWRKRLSEYETIGSHIFYTNKAP